MQKSGVMFFKRVVAYILGTVFFVIGAAGLGIEITLGTASSDDFVIRFVMPAICLACGTLICIATLLRYGGGLWFVFGVLLVGVAIYATVGLFRVYSLGQHLASPATSYSRTAAVWVIGLFCLVMGHIAHRKRQQSPPNTALEPTPTAP